MIVGPPYWLSPLWVQAVKKRRFDSMSIQPGPPKPPLRRFLEVRNGKETPENVVILRFYTV
jgi:hypothetical protein